MSRARRVVVGGSQGWSSRALVILGAFLLALCAWLLFRADRPTSAALEASGTVDPCLPRREGPPPEAISAKAEPADRTLATEVGTQDSPSPAVAGIVRLEARVYGSLLDASNAPIRGARSAGVSFVDHTGRRLTADARQDGSYELHALGFGRYWVTASADGYRSLEETVDLRPDQPLMRKDFTLHKAFELRVKVTTPEGRDLFEVLKETGAPMGARVLVPVATAEPPVRRFEEVAGSLNDKFGVGRFQNHGPGVEKLASGCMGILFLDCDLPVCVSLVHYHVVLQTKRVGRGQGEVTFVLSPHDLLADLATIRVQVVDAETRLSIRGARVMLWGGTYSHEGVATDPEGVATIDRREPGRFDLQIRAKGYAKFQKPIDAPPGGITDLGTVALEKEVTVEGRVIDLEDYPLAASFSLGILDPLDHSIHWFREVFTSGGDGSFEIRGLGRREYVIRTNNHDAANEGEWEGIPWVSGNLLLDTRAGSIAGLEVRLRPASKLVLHAAKGAADRMRFRVVDERGLELVASHLHGSEPCPLQLPAGSYRVSLLDALGAVLLERPLTLGSETVKVDLAR